MSSKRLPKAIPVFLSGFRFLSVEKRNAITVLYAFCRELDDVVDGCTDPNVAQITLNWWRSDLEKVFNNEMPEHPVHQALKDIRANFDLPKNEFDALIDGMQMDLEQARYGSFDELKLYCHRVAGVSGVPYCADFRFFQSENFGICGQNGLGFAVDEHYSRCGRRCATGKNLSADRGNAEV